MKQNKKSHARQRFLEIAQPNPNPKIGDIPDRDTWIEQTCQSFVAHSKANKTYYRAVLECLWPCGHGIPGPVINSTQLREAITNARKLSSGGQENAPYLDPFRRIRELQGEEGVTGIARVGPNYQLVNLNVQEKRIPRTGLSEKEWLLILSKYSGKCAVCRREPPDVQLQQDHKIPRLRHGSDELSNWQPLCDECNNFKSTCCRGCTADCMTCPWAFPEKYAPIRILPDNISRIRKLAKEKNIDPSNLLNNIIEGYLSSIHFQ